MTTLSHRSRVTASSKATRYGASIRQRKGISVPAGIGERLIPMNLSAPVEVGREGAGRHDFG
jgi:hypothetical protein